jgi:hypothetical protein
LLSKQTDSDRYGDRLPVDHSLFPSLKEELHQFEEQTFLKTGRFLELQKMIEMIEESRDICLI